VFLAGRTTATKFKVSLHSSRASKGLSREGHHGLTAEYVKMLRTFGKWADESRHFTKWRGRELAPGVWEQFLLFIPGNALRTIPEAPSRLTEVMWIPPPPEGHHAVVAVYIGPAQMDEQAPRATGLLGHGRLCDGRTLWIVHRNMRRKPADYGGDPSGRVRAPIPSNVRLEALRAPDVRAILFGLVGETGSWVELAGDMIIPDPMGALRTWI
jgi:hypothetical protein